MRQAEALRKAEQAQRRSLAALGTAALFFCLWHFLLGAVHQGHQGPPFDEEGTASKSIKALEMCINDGTYP